MMAVTERGSCVHGALVEDVHGGWRVCPDCADLVLVDGEVAKLTKADLDAEMQGLWQEGREGGFIDSQFEFRGRLLAVLFLLGWFR